MADAEAGTDRFANLARIGIDEISYKRGHKYLTVVVDHGTGVLFWAHPGRNKETLDKFFIRLGGDADCRAADERRGSRSRGPCSVELLPSRERQEGLHVIAETACCRT